jgi:CBS domain-containing protein
MAGRRLHVLPVTDDQGRLVGVITPAEVFRRVLAGRENFDVIVMCKDGHLFVPGLRRPDEVRWHLAEDPVVVEGGAGLADIARRLAESRVRYAVVVDEQRRPIGVISRGDVLASGGFPLPASEESVPHPSPAGRA